LKPRLLVVAAVLASFGFGWWLLDQPHTSRELFLSMVAWVLGFWVASGIQRSVSPPDEEAEEEWEEDEG